MVLISPLSSMFTSTNVPGIKFKVFSGHSIKQTELLSNISIIPMSNNSVSSLILYRSK